MKTYIGTKVVKAEPMTHGEANKRGLLQPNRTVRDADAPGYLVEYDNGCQSWSPKYVFDKAYRVAETALDRMEIENLDLDDKCRMLTEFITSEKFAELDQVSQVMAETQLAVMYDYYDVQSLRFTKMECGDGGLRGLNFSVALKLLKSGFCIRRDGWIGKDVIVFRQVPAHITEEIIPKMQSLPPEAKKHILASNCHIDYASQCLIYDTSTGEADSWTPSISDIFASDWELVQKV